MSQQLSDAAILAYACSVNGGQDIDCAPYSFQLLSLLPKRGVQFLPALLTLEHNFVDGWAIAGGVIFL